MKNRFFIDNFPDENLNKVKSIIASNYDAIEEFRAQLCANNCAMVTFEDSQNDDTFGELVNVLSENGYKVRIWMELV